MLAFFEPCPRHPHNTRTDDGELVTVPHRQAKNDRVLVAVPVAALRSADGPYGA